MRARPSRRASKKNADRASLDLNSASIDKDAVCAQLRRVMDGVLPLQFVYQPVVDLSRATVAGYEALVRFPEEVGLPPDRCLALAEECGMGPAMEALVFGGAVRAQNQLPPNCFLTVNVSPYLLLSDYWTERVASLDNLSTVVIEITEQDRIDDYDRARRRLEAARNLGAAIAVDDIGSGFASLKHVMELRPSFVKLDRLFVRECHADPAKATFIEMIGTAADRLDAWIIAEGVETAEELEELMRLEIPLAQGFHLGRPAETMQPLPQETVLHLQQRTLAQGQTATMEGYMEACTVLRSRVEAAALLAGNRRLKLAVVADEWNRPIELIERHPLAGIRSLVQVMKTQVASHPAQVLQRALTRPAANRFDPVAVVDELGVLRGIVRMERLMAAVLEGKPQQNQAQ